MASTAEYQDFSLSSSVTSSDNELNSVDGLSNLELRFAVKLPRYKVENGLLDSLIPAIAALVQAAIQGKKIIIEDSKIVMEKISDELSTIEAARYLEVSRPTLMKLIRSGEIPATKVGSHHRLKTSDVIQFADKRSQEQKETRAKLLDEIFDLENVLGLE